MPWRLQKYESLGVSKTSEALSPFSARSSVEIGSNALDGGRRCGSLRPWLVQVILAPALDHDPLGERIVLNAERDLIHAIEVEGIVRDLDRRRFVHLGVGANSSFFERIDVDVERFSLDDDLALDLDERAERIVVGTRRHQKSGKDYRSGAGAWRGP